MVTKDLNHPSVILYSIGNEVPERQLAPVRERPVEHTVAILMSCGAGFGADRDPDYRQHARLADGAPAG